MTTEKKVTVHSISISKGWSDEDKYTCTVALKADEGKIELKLAEDDVNRVVELVADLVVQATKKVMANMTAAAMQHAAIEHQPEADDDAD